MDTDRDPYEVLGVPRNASDDDVKEAYREKAKEYHPDASDREDAAEVFKRVKEAYEELYTDEEGRGAGLSSSDSPSADVRTGKEAETEAEKETRTGGRGDRTRGGFGAEWRREAEPGAGFGASGGFGSGADRGTEAGEQPGSGFGGARGERWEEGDEDEESNEEAEEDPEEFEVREELDVGWKLGETDTGDWFVFTEGETAPYVDGKQMLYLDTEGRMSTDPVYFGTRSVAKKTYEEHYGEESGFEHEHEAEWEESHRGFSPDGESYEHRTEERGDGFGDEAEGWGERQEADSLDELWKLYYQERKEGDVEGETRRRWGVTTDVAGDDRFVNPGGEYQEVEFWFEERREAMRAYEEYVRKTRAARQGFEGTVKEGAEVTSQNKGEEAFTIRTASMGYLLFEDLRDATEPVREHALAVATVLVASVAVSAYLFEPFRRLLVAPLLPVYVGFVTILRTPYLLFFIFAYAAIVTGVLMIHISTRY